MTGMQFSDVLRDAAMLSGGTPEYAWVRDWQTPRGVPLGLAADAAATASGGNGLLPLWLRECACAFHGRYTVDAAGFARAMDGAAVALRDGGALLFPYAVRQALEARTFAAWSARAFAVWQDDGENALGAERVFLPWLCAMRARFVQE